MSSRIDESVGAHLDPSRHEHSPYVLDIRPSPEFRYDAGRKKLIDLRITACHGPRMNFAVPGDDDDHEVLGDRLDPGFTRHQADLLRLSAIVDLDNRLSVSCAGAVLIYLQRRRSVQYLPGDVDAENSFRVTKVEMFGLDGVMY